METIISLILLKIFLLIGQPVGGKFIRESAEVTIPDDSYVGR